MGTGFFQQHDDDSRLQMYPVPAAAFVTIDWPGARDAVVLQLFDLLGNEVFSERTADWPVQVSVEMLSSGWYLVRATSLSGSQQTLPLLIF